MDGWYGFIYIFQSSCLHTYISLMMNEGLDWLTWHDMTWPDLTWPDMVKKRERERDLHYITDEEEKQVKWNQIKSNQIKSNEEKNEREIICNACRENQTGKEYREMMEIDDRDRW